MNDKIRYFFPKVKNRIRINFTNFFKYLPVEKISLFGIDSISTKSDILFRLEKMVGAGLPEIISAASVEEKSLILDKAFEAKQHIFNVLGSGPVMMKHINWCREIKTGYEWPVGVFYKELRSLTPKGSDIKIPWEISRCHHLLWMAEAYSITTDETYAEEVVKQIRHWIRNNPLMYSVNWTCAMDVSIRAINWIYSIAIIGKSKFFTDEFAQEVYASLYQHLFFINRNLEKNIPYSNNHYFTDIVGQLFLGQLFSTTECGKITLKRAIKEYVKELEIQIFPSGVNYEKSVSYHRLMTELALYPYYMLCRIGINLPKIVIDRLSGMLGYINQYTMGNGSSPLVSDNDDGRLLPFVPYPFMKHSYLINPHSLDSHVGANGCQLVAPAYDSTNSCIHTDANLSMLKKGNLYLFTSCFNRWRYDKQKSRFENTHLHNDLLSFVFADGNTPIIVDPGAYCYTSDYEAWKAFRTAKKHNTVVVDDEEPNILGHSTFLMKYNTNAKTMSYTTGQMEHCEGEYSTIMGKMTHHREFDLSSSGLTITDKLSKQGNNHKVYMSFHFDEGVKAETEGKLIKLHVSGKQYRIKVECEVPFLTSIRDDMISPSFGVLKESKTLVVEFVFDNNVICKTQIDRI